MESQLIKENLWISYDFKKLNKCLLFHYVDN